MMFVVDIYARDHTPTSFNMYLKFGVGRLNR